MLALYGDYERIATFTIFSHPASGMLTIMCRSLNRNRRRQPLQQYRQQQQCDKQSLNKNSH